MQQVESIKSICVFCGSSIGFDKCFHNLAVELGKRLAAMKIKLIYGGAGIGLMRLLADAVFDNGGKVVGVMPVNLVNMNVAYNRVNDIVICETMSERKTKMLEMSDAYIAMPGGCGTLDELTEVMTMYQLRQKIKPIAILNVDNFFYHFISQLDTCVAKGFIRQEHRDNLIVADNLDMLFDKIFNFVPIPVDHKWVDKIIDDSKKIINHE